MVVDVLDAEPVLDLGHGQSRDARPCGFFSSPRFALALLAAAQPRDILRTRKYQAAVLVRGPHDVIGVRSSSIRIESTSSTIDEVRAAAARTPSSPAMLFPR